eukprot:7901811-Alexandrium_andersonii.AAC.1
MLNRVAWHESWHVFSACHARLLQVLRAWRAARSHQGRQERSARDDVPMSSDCVVDVRRPASGTASAWAYEAASARQVDARHGSKLLRGTTWGSHA